jgi:hypothetical protein
MLRTQYNCISYDPQNKSRLAPNTTLSDWSFVMESSAQYKLSFKMFYRNFAMQSVKISWGKTKRI